MLQLNYSMKFSRLRRVMTVLPGRFFRNVLAWNEAVILGMKEQVIRPLELLLVLKGVVGYLREFLNDFFRHQPYTRQKGLVTDILK